MDVHLAHVVARVVPLNLPDVKFPSVVTVVTHLMLGFVFCYRFTMGGCKIPLWLMNVTLSLKDLRLRSLVP